MEFTEDFRRGVEDYRLFLERGYPEGTLKKVVGDRHRLSREERLVLFRGVSTEAADRRRRGKRCDPAVIDGSRLLIDFYNVAFVVLNYRLGRPVFFGTDSFVRDAGALHGRLGREERLDAVLPAILDSVARLNPGEAIFFLDAPVSHSGAHAKRILSQGAGSGCPVSTELVKSADYPLKQAPPDSVVATGDSAVIEAVETGVIDLAALVLRDTFDFVPPDLRAFI